MSIPVLYIMLSLLAQTLCLDATNITYYDYPAGLGGYGVVDEASGRSWFLFDDLDDARWLAYEVVEAAIFDQDTGSISVGQLTQEAYEQMQVADAEALAPFLGAYVAVEDGITSVTGYAYEQPPPAGLDVDFCGNP